MKKRIHFIGIGGIGMSGVAKLFLRQGAEVSGSDIKDGKMVRALKQAGAEVFLGHSPENVRDKELVVYSSAIAEDNPELCAAREQGTTLLKRAEALAELMREKTVITVTGSHGKTTTTSLLSHVMLEAGLTPTAAIGGILLESGTNAMLGEGEFFVAEADESDGSFLHYQPTYSIITNLDREHLDYYGDSASQAQAFSKFLEKTSDSGCAFCCGDDPGLAAILKGYRKRLVRFGFNQDCDILAREIRVCGFSRNFDCLYKGRSLGRFELALAGAHNISNALAVIAVGIELGISPGVISGALASYKGARRRLEVRYKDKGYLLVDDYAHHPTEIRATLAALKELKPRRLIAAFQPHRYTRTKLLLKEFACCFGSADKLIITDIYPAGEAPIKGIDGMSIFEEVKRHSPDQDLRFLAKEEICAQILNDLKPQDLVVTLGAGDITKVCDELEKGLKVKG
ncbi:UDP-N-acetylmuramate--L-alanine ligase [Candidatus Omnitrophota bacterium]